MKIGYLMQAGVPDVRRRPLSGPANHVKQVFSELKALGNEVCLMCQLDDQIWKTHDLDDFELVSIPRLEQGLFRLFERAIRRFQYELRLPYIALFESLRFAQACRQELKGFDLFYERMGWVGYGGGLVSKWMDIPLVLEVNGDYLPEMEMLGKAPQGVQRWISTKLTKNAVKQAVAIVTTGDGWRLKFIERWQVDPDNVTTIENGSELVELMKREQLQSFRSIVNDENGIIKIVYVGAFEPWHGISVLLEAAAQALSQGVYLHIILIGTGSELPRIEKLVCELNLEPHITFTGYLTLEKCIPFLADAQIAVSPYCGRVEYSGLKLLDYKAAGLTTIASGSNDQPTVLEHGRTGWIIPPCDAMALGEAIVHLSTHPELRRKIGQAARIEAEKYHTWRYTTQQLLALLNQVYKAS